MATTERALPRTNGVSTGEEGAGTSRNISQASHHPRTATQLAETDAVGTDELIALVRRAPALEALREQPLDRRELQERLDVSRPTVHRLTRALGEKGLVERSSGVLALTGLGETVADVVCAFTRNVETAFRLAPLLETIQYRYPDFDVAAFADATVTTAEPSDPYRPVRRYYSLIEETDTLRGFDTTTLSPEYVDAVHRQISEGMETRLVYPPAVAARLQSAQSEWLSAAVESGHLDLRVHDDLPHGLVVFDDRIAIASYCETTGTLRAFIDTDAPAAREWAESVYESYWTDAERFDARPNTSPESVRTAE